MGSSTQGANAQSTAVITVTPGATPSVPIVTDQDCYATWTAAENETLAISGTHKAGQKLQLEIVNDAGGARTITFGTGFRAKSTLVGTASDVAVITFVSDGTNFVEVSRTTAIV